MSRRRRISVQSFRSLAIALIVFMGAQLALSGVLEFVRPDLRDPEFGPRVTRLLAEQRQQPHRLEIVALGSSRTLMGFRPSAAGFDDRRVFACNMAQSGSGPQEELLRYQRLRRYGVRPNRLLVEVMPIYLTTDTNQIEQLTPIDRLTWREFSRIEARLPDPARARRDWTFATAFPCYGHRTALLNRFGHTATDGDGWAALGATGWPADRRRQWTDGARGQYSAILANWQVAPAPDQALRQLLAASRADGIPTALVLMPESPEFRTWYGPHSNERLLAYLRSLTEENGARLIDAREWIADEMQFADGHHLLTAGADEFSRRLERGSGDFLRP